MGLKVELLTFEQGIVDELVEIRATALNHGKGARRMENMLALPQGPAMSRPPSRFVASTKSNGVARLIHVVYSETIAFEVEFGNGYCRFFTDEGQVLSGGAVYEIASPYATADLDRLQVWNDAGTLYLADGSHPPYRLVYSGSSSWSLEAIPFTWGPFRDPNDSVCTITPSGTTANITLTAAGGSPFVTGASGHVGAKWLIGHRVSRSSTVHTFTTDGEYGAFSVPLGAGCSLATSGTWNGTLYVEKSYDGGTTWESAGGPYAPAEDKNFTDVFDETLDDATYRLRFADWTSGSCKVTFAVEEHVAYGYVTITAVSSATVASATVVETLAAATATTIWAEGSWSPYRGYPRGVGCVDNRLTLVGSAADPTTQWLTRPNKYTQMRADTTAASALTFAFTVGRGDPFLWILGEQYQYTIGTPSAIFQIAAADPRSAISAENKPEIQRRIDFGSAAIAPVRAMSTTILVDSSATRPMKITYDWEQDLLLAPDLAFQCPTITTAGVKRMVFQRGRVPVVWFLLEDGTLLARTLEMLFREEIGGWSECYTAGTDALIEDIDVLPGDDGDVLWWIVSRTIDGATVRTVEKLDLLDLKPQRATAHALDSCLGYAGEDWADVEGLAVDAGTGVVTVTITGHALEDGDQVDLADLVGAEWLNSRVLTVADAATDTFTLKTLSGSYVDGRLLTAYASGGRVRQVENTFAGLDHLEGQTVYAVADGAVLGPYTVDGGEITLSRYANAVVVGLFVDAWLQPLRLAIPMQDGSSRARQQNVSGLWISLYRSSPCEVGPDATHLQPLPSLAVDEAVESQELLTDEYYVPLTGKLTADPTVLIHRNRPLPLCVRGLMLDTDVGGTRGGKL